jgi:hypothetical protein
MERTLSQLTCLYQSAFVMGKSVCVYAVSVCLRCSSYIDGAYDVWFLRVVLGVAVGLRSACHGRRLLDVVGVDGLHASDGLMGRHFCGCGGEMEVEVKVEEGQRMVAVESD